MPNNGFNLTRTGFSSSEGARRAG